MRLVIGAELSMLCVSVAELAFLTPKKLSAKTCARIRVLLQEANAWPWNSS